MRRTKTMLMGDLLEEFFKRPYVAAKAACPTRGAQSSATGLPT